MQKRMPVIAIFISLLFMLSTDVLADVARGATIFWRNMSTGENTVWYMGGSTHTGTATLDPLSGAWRMAATADFNNDGEADILWRNVSTGANMVWYMNGATHTGSADLDPVTDQNWRIVGVADFNSDGKPDILWRNISTGANMVWYMNGATHTGSADLTRVTDQNWRIVGVADFNSDGKPDILWRNSVSGVNEFWYMNGITYADFAMLDPVTDQNWRIVGVADLNKDGNPDILWRNTATGANMVWYMNGITYRVAMLDPVTDQSMEMAGQGNYSPINGQCGSANNQTFTTAPGSNLCNVGKASMITGTGPWSWTCAALSGGTDASCQANMRGWIVTPSAGANGTISPNTPQSAEDDMTKSFTIIPNAGYAASVGGTCGGAPSSGSGPFAYITDPINADCTVVATFTKLFTGVCGSAHGSILASAPTTGLCSEGLASAVTGAGPWIWTCAGATTTVQCQANPPGWTVTSTVAGGNGTISCASPVSNGMSGFCTIKPIKGYRLGTLTDNGTDVTGKVAGNVYTLPTVTANHAVTASFVTRGTSILWRNISTGENTVWYMDGSAHTGTAMLDPLPGAWRMVATADFNSDGEADILWRNISTGANMVWYMDEATRTSSVDLDPLADQNWRIVGAGDFNNDRKPDILWRNISTGANMVWFMNGATHTGSADLAIVPTQDWKMVGAADFNSDGKSDIVWRNSVTGQNVVWYMDGITRTGLALLETATDQNWKIIVGTTDLDKDGNLDILWRNIATGANMVWYMNGPTRAGSADLDPVTDQNMEIVAQGNYSASPTPPGSQCGSSTGGTFTTAPTTNLCSVGTASAVTGSGPWTWTCKGWDGDATVSCSANVKTWTVTASAGSGGAISPSAQQVVNHGTIKSFSIAPDVGYGASVSGTCGGTPSRGTGPFTYNTDPITADCAVVATFDQIVIGVCGSANGGTFTSAPGSNLCTLGNASAVTGSGPWIWTCQGPNGAAQCQANPRIWTVTSSVTGGNGTISCTSPVNEGQSSTCVINQGNLLATLTDNGSDVKAQVAGNAYIIPNVTANHLVTASFVARGPSNGAILLRNISTGENRLWYMDGATHTDTATLDPLPGPWRMVGTADFNSDGAVDILWRNTSTGANMVWYMNGATLKGSADLAPVTDQNWKVVGVADFNGDGRPDILWRNTSTGANMVWYMNRGMHTGSADLTPVPDQNWNIVGAADFNSDGRPDILWRNSATGLNVVWHMEGINRTNSVVLDKLPDQNWKVVGTIDLNKDGRPDILWRNISNGANMVWYMDGVTYAGLATLDTVTDQNIQIIGEDNYSPPAVLSLDGECGYANNQTFTVAPGATLLCNVGSVSEMTGSGPWAWICKGLNGGANANCSANVNTWTVTPSAGSNGAISPNTQQTVSHGSMKSFTITPSAGYAASVSGTCGGAPLSGIGPFTYTTDPVITDCTVVATFTQILTGVCGLASGGTFTAAPTSNLCSVGTASTVTGSGPWIWTCQGATSTVQCQANPKAWTITSYVTGGNGTISCASPVNHGLSAPCTINPNKGYRLGTLTDNGVDVMGQVAGNVYTIPAVTTTHALIASFVTRGSTIFWHNISSGENKIWYMTGSTHTGTATLEPLTGAWKMVGTADFNLDGEADILWRNTATGANMVWYMKGITHTGSADLAPVADQNWKIVGAADFNGDGKPDILWRNTATGANMVWYMDGATHTGSADLWLVADQNWKIVGVGDFTGDGSPDILWRNSVTGVNVIWYMEGIIHTSFTLLDTVADQNWKLVGATDLDNDGKPDILWRNSVTGQNLAWYMNGVTITQSVSLDTEANLNLEMAGQNNN